MDQVRAHSVDLEKVLALASSLQLPFDPHRHASITFESRIHPSSRVSKHAPAVVLLPFPHVRSLGSLPAKTDTCVLHP